MSWVSYAKLQALCNALRQKFTSSEIVLANDAKNVGVHFNHTAQDGLVAISPMTEDGSTPAALWVTDSEANNATEITAGTFSYVTDNGKDTEDFTSMSLVGGVVNVSGKNGDAKRITNIADPTANNDAVNLNTLKSYTSIDTYSYQGEFVFSSSSALKRLNAGYALKTGFRYIVIADIRIINMPNEINIYTYISAVDAESGNKKLFGGRTTLENPRSILRDVYANTVVLIDTEADGYSLGVDLNKLDNITSDLSGTYTITVLKIKK